MSDYRNSTATSAASVFDKVFKPGELTFGLLTPLEGYPNSDTPTMRNHTALATLADDLGFAALWLRMYRSGIPLLEMWARSMTQWCMPVGLPRRRDILRSVLQVSCFLSVTLSQSPNKRCRLIN